MELYYVICVCISEKNNGHCKRIIGENNGQKIGALIIGKILSIIYQGLAAGRLRPGSHRCSRSFASRKLPRDGAAGFSAICVHQFFVELWKRYDTPRATVQKNIVKLNVRLQNFTKEQVYTHSPKRGHRRRFRNSGG